MSGNVENLFKSVINASSKMNSVSNKTNIKSLPQGTVKNMKSPSSSTTSMFSSTPKKELALSKTQKNKASNMSTTGSSPISTVTNTKGLKWATSMFSSTSKKESPLTEKVNSNKTNRENNINIKISKIKEITQLVKNDCIYIDITNLIGDYKFSLSINENNYFESDTLLNTIIYSIISNNENNKDNKNLIIYFIRHIDENNQKIYIYNVNENIQYNPIII